jgi:A/G-specific adenine glycosylase
MPGVEPAPPLAPAGGSTRFAELVIAWFARHARDLPWRRPGFSPWGTLVSEFMLQQTPVGRVIPRLEEWLTRWPEPADLAAEPAGEAVRAWQSLGYPRRALNLHACAVAITERFGGTVPNDVAALLSLPGVGDYTARAVAVFAYGARHPVVDTNIRRVIARAVDGQPDPAAPNAKRDLPAMEAVLPLDVDASARFNAGMMELGALICTARSPKCDLCPLAALCAWRAAGYPATEVARRPPQKKYEGSDRQARGAILKLLRATDHPVPTALVAEAVPNPAQRGRALAGLLTDGLIVAHTDDEFALP